MPILQLSGYDRFSSTVRLELRAEGKTFKLAGIGPSEIFPRDQIDLPACQAEIWMDVDGQQYIWPVSLEHGAVPFDSIIGVVSRGEIQRTMSEADSLR